MLRSTPQLSQEYFRQCHRYRGTSGATLLNYPPRPEQYQLTDEDIRAGPHKDWGSVTLLFQNEEGEPGLEIFLPNNDREEDGVGLRSDTDLGKGRWHASPIVPDTVLINLGLAMEMWTFRQCVATLH